MHSRQVSFHHALSFILYTCGSQPCIYSPRMPAKNSNSKCQEVHKQRRWHAAVAMSWRCSCLQQRDIFYRWSSTSDKSEQFKCKARATRMCSQDWTLGVCTCIELNRMCVSGCKACPHECCPTLVWAEHQCAYSAKIETHRPHTSSGTYLLIRAKFSHEALMSSCACMKRYFVTSAYHVEL